MPQKEIQLELRSVLQPDTLGGFAGYPAGAPLDAPDVESQDIASQFAPPVPERPVPELRVPSLGRARLDTSDLEQRIRAAAAITGKWVKAGAREYVRTQLPSAIIAGDLTRRAFEREPEVEATAQAMHQAIDAPQGHKTLTGLITGESPKPPEVEVAGRSVTPLLKAPGIVGRFLAHLGVDIAADTTTPGGAVSTLLDPSHVIGPGAKVGFAAATLIPKVTKRAAKKAAAKAAQALVGKTADEVASTVASAEEQVVEKIAASPEVRQLAAQFGLHPSTTARRILREIKQQGGYSVNLATGEVNPPGVFVGVYPNTDAAHNVNLPFKQLTLRELERARALNEQELARSDRYFGGWRDTSASADTVYLEPSQRHPPTAEGLRAATKQGEAQVPPQKAVYYKRDQTDPGTFPPVGDWYAFITGPEFQRRLDLMQQVGSQHMAGIEWWDLHGGPLERVYGADWLRPVAGFLAATSPRTYPEKNLRLASEYIRRLKVFVQRKAAEWQVPESEALARLQGKLDPALGEELKAAIIQPEYRVPATAVGTDPGPGAMMFDETSRTANLVKAARGDVDAMRKDKVNDMVHALLGADVAVIDRRFAKLADAPAEGVYVQKGNTVQASMRDPAKNKPVSGTWAGEYALIENAVRDAAKRAGLPVKVYSAEAWEGIGETIKRTGELFGVKHPAGAIPESSQGFNVLFPKVVADKAKKLGLTVEQMEAGLREGKLELLTAILATPVGWRAYQEWQHNRARASGASTR